MTERRFQGFPPECVDFMWELRFNNNKEWFEKNRDRYKRYLKQPMDDFAADMTKDIMALYQEKEVVSQVCRINRDIRFSKNKMPYKDHKWVIFRFDGGSWRENPVLFFELRPESYSYGTGFYDNVPRFMKGFRSKVDANPGEFQRLLDRFHAQKEFRLDGEKYKKKMGNYKEDVMDGYSRTSRALIAEFPLDESVYTGEIYEKVRKGFSFLIPYQKYLKSIKSQP